MTTDEQIEKINEQSKAHIKEEILRYEERGEYYKAAELSEKIGDYELAKSYKSLADYFWIVGREGETIETRLSDDGLLSKEQKKKMETWLSEDLELSKEEEAELIEELERM